MSHRQHLIDVNETRYELGECNYLCVIRKDTHPPELEVEAASDIQLLRPASRPCLSVPRNAMKNKTQKKGEEIKTKRQPNLEFNGVTLLELGIRFCRAFIFSLILLLLLCSGKQSKLNNDYNVWNWKQNKRKRKYLFREIMNFGGSASLGRTARIRLCRLVFNQWLQTLLHIYTNTRTA